MRITHMRFRKLVSRAIGYGHDAAEIEVALDDGDDPAVVSAELHRLVDAEVRQGEEREKLVGTLDEYRKEVVWLECQLSGLSNSINARRATIKRHNKFIADAVKAGVEVPSDISEDEIPF